MSKQGSGREKPAPKEWDHGGSSVNAPKDNRPPVNWANNANGSSRGKQGKG
jgi:hypothetical protein